MKFIGRKGELAVLEKEFSRDAGFVIIYGRRRIGKTTLIKKFIENKPAFYFLATEEAEMLSMKRFAGVLSRVMNRPSLKNVTFNDWTDIFGTIAEYEPSEKKIVVIDEYPYLVRTNPTFPSILQTAWDEILKDRNVMLILCGSQISMMKKHALEESSPIYGRRTAQIKLSPLGFGEVYGALGMSFEDTAELYSVIGGVPKYLELFDTKAPLTDNLRSLAFSSNGFLYDEPQFLLKDEVQSTINYFSILRAIAGGNHKLGDIASSFGADSTAITPYITTLMGLGFIEKQVPITEKYPEKSRKGLYFIADPFIKYWFRYVYPFKGELELGNINLAMEEMKKDFVSKHVAFAYEDICKEIFADLCAEGKISLTPSRISSYWQNDVDTDVQIDVMAYDKTHKILFAGECKYHNKPVGADVYFDLCKKVEGNAELKKAFPDYAVIYGLFSKSGFSDRLLEVAKDVPELVLINKDAVIGR